MQSAALLNENNSNKEIYSALEKQMKITVKDY